MGKNGLVHLHLFCFLDLLFFVFILHLFCFLTFIFSPFILLPVFFSFEVVFFDVIFLHFVQVEKSFE